MSKTQPPLIAHVIFRLTTGGLENGLVNLINHMPPERYRHAIICLTTATSFQKRIKRSDVEIYELHKREGQDWGLYLRLWKTFKQLQPDIIHTRNLSALEAQLPALFALVKARVHSEHGWDTADPDGSNKKYRMLRRLFRVLVSHYIALSNELKNYLVNIIGVSEQRITRICNGVDNNVFKPALNGREALPSPGFADSEHIVIGTVGRMQPVKDQLNLVDAFIILLNQLPQARNRLRLALLGDGPLMPVIVERLQQADALDLTWLPGDRADVPDLLHGFDIFVLPSKAEGISNTILEAMATGLPVVATSVGGNAELVDDGNTGVLVSPENPAALAQALLHYINNPAQIKYHGANAYQRVQQNFSLDAMVNQYLAVYDRVITK